MIGALAPALIGMLAGGGLSKIMSGFSSAGMDDKAKSWVSNDANKPLSPDDVKQVVDHDQIAQVAQKAGISHDEAAGVIAQALPAIVNHLTPDGQLPDPATADQKLSQMHAADPLGRRSRAAKGYRCRTRPPIRARRQIRCVLSPQP